MPSFSPYTLGLNPYREIVFRSTSQIAGVRTVNRLFAPFSDVRKKKGLRISADPSSRMRKIGFIVVLLRGCLFSPALFCLPAGSLWCFPWGDIRTRLCRPGRLWAISGISWRVSRSTAHHSPSSWARARSSSSVISAISSRVFTSASTSTRSRKAP